MTKRTIFRQGGTLKEIQAALEAAGSKIGEPSLARVEDLFLAAMSVTPGNRRHFVHLAVTEMHQLAVRDSLHRTTAALEEARQAGMGA